MSFVRILHRCWLLNFSTLSSVNFSLVPPENACGLNAEWLTTWTLPFQVFWNLCGALGPDPIVKAAGSSSSLRSSHWVHGSAWPQGPRKSSIVSKRAQGLRKMPANQSYPQWSPDLAAEGQGSMCEVRRERASGAGAHSVRRWLWPVARDLGRGQKGQIPDLLPLKWITIPLLRVSTMWLVSCIQIPSCFSGKYDAANGGKVGWKVSCTAWGKGKQLPAECLWVRSS